MKRILCASVLMLALSGVAFAEPISSAPTSAPAAPAAADPGYATRLQLAHDLIRANGGEAALRRQMKIMFSAVSTSVASSLPKDASNLANHFQDRIQAEMLDTIPALIDVTVKAYADNFSEQELRDLLAFQLSPSGQSMMKKMPAVTQDVVSKTMPMMMQKIPAMVQAAAVQACEDAHCTAEDRKQVDAALSKALAPPVRPAS